ncbi:MAG: YwhD family protein, partial [Alicyclobacillus sp.]|nr:YwhD family protein [Alicyclobacillus sp.]
FTRSLEELHPTREVWVIWLTLRRGEDGQQGFAGAQPFRIWVDAQQRLGYKSLSEQVNRMDRAVKGQVDLTAVPAPVRQRAAAYLRQVRPDLWERASAAFREGWEA